MSRPSEIAKINSDAETDAAFDKSALPAMTANDYGRILLIASIAGKEGNAGMVRRWPGPSRGREPFLLLCPSPEGRPANARHAPTGPTRPLAQAAYSTSKAGVIGLVKAVGKEYAETGITVNALAPAAIYTSMLENATEEAVVSH